MTVPDTMNPGPEVVDQLRQMFKQKIEQNAAKIPPGGFHEHDMNKVMANDVWLTKFLENNDLDMNKSVEQLWDTCMWRKTDKINEISEDNIRLDYVKDGVLFSRGKDLDGKTLLIYRSKFYTRGSRDLDEMKRIFLYWLERCIREANDDYITFMFELTDAGLSNVDMDLTKHIITTLKNYYPFSLNYILVYDLPWILNATFQIIKRLLPAKAVDRLRNINNKTIRDYIDDDNMLVPWGGKDDYEFHFVPEQRQLLNNNSSYINHNNNNMKKVHFANLNPSESPMNESAKINHENADGEMLRIIPQNNIVFTKSGNELVGNVEIINIHVEPVTYKIKTTAPEKFRVRPSTGVLSPGANVTINVVLQHGHQIIALNREKFLVMCMAFTNDLSTSSQDLADLWKNTSPSSATVEQHRLKCSMPAANMEENTLRNGLPLHVGTGAGDIFGAGAGYSGSGSDNQLLHFQQVMAQLNETTQRLETQAKHNQRTQIISIFVFLLLSIAIVYILKAEIKNSVSQYH